MTCDEHDPRPSQERDARSDGAEPPVSDPAEMLRLTTMLQALTAEIRDIDLDESGRARLLDIHQTAVHSLRGLLSSDLDQELGDLGLPIQDDDASGPELRVAQAQLVGWLSGLFQGLQAAAMARPGTSQGGHDLPSGAPQLPEGGGGQYL